MLKLMSHSDSRPQNPEEAGKAKKKNNGQRPSFRFGVREVELEIIRNRKEQRKAKNDEKHSGQERKKSV